MTTKFDRKDFAHLKRPPRCIVWVHGEGLEKRVTIPTDDEFVAAVRLLLAHAKFRDLGGDQCAAFVLSAWNGRQVGVAIDGVVVNAPTDLLAAMMTVIAYLHVHRLSLPEVMPEEVLGPARECMDELFRPQVRG